MIMKVFTRCNTIVVNVFCATLRQRLEDDLAGGDTQETRVGVGEGKQEDIELL